MTSSLHTAAYRTEFGRKLNNHSEIYSLPADEEELERLGEPSNSKAFFQATDREHHTDLQHELVKDATGGKYAPPMAEVLTPEYEGDLKACLDLGCGSGSW